MNRLRNTYLQVNIKRDIQEISVYNLILLTKRFERTQNGRQNYSETLYKIYLYRDTWKTHFNAFYVKISKQVVFVLEEEMIVNP